MMNCTVHSLLCSTISESAEVPAPLLLLPSGFRSEAGVRVPCLPPVVMVDARCGRPVCSCCDTRGSFRLPRCSGGDVGASDGRPSGSCWRHLRLETRRHVPQVIVRAS